MRENQQRLPPKQGSGRGAMQWHGKHAPRTRQPDVQPLRCASTAARRTGLSFTPMSRMLCISL